LVKDTADLDFVEGVKVVARGGAYFSPSVKELVAEGVSGVGSRNRERGGGSHNSR
jgi:hypothetical protein